MSAKKAVIDLVRSFGFEVIDGGALTNARYLEPMAEFMTQLGYGLGHGGEIGFALVRADR
jgi:predicted dinucleotide-binding enzyme